MHNLFASLGAERPIKLRREHFGPEPHFSSGPEAVHSSIHEASIGKTIAAVYLGDDEPCPYPHPEDHFPIDGLFRSEYLILEFTDGRSLVLQIGSGNTFHIPGDREAAKMLRTAKNAARERRGTVV
jgi:hypothetical protein